MSNKEYNILLKKLSKANQKYKDLLFEAEGEFEKRYGKYPSDIDCSGWIDTYHIGIGFMSAEQVKKEAVRCLEIFELSGGKRW